MFSAEDISDQRRSLESFHNADKNHRLHTERFVDGYHQLLDENLALSRELEKERAKNQRRALGPERKPFVLVIVDGNSYIFKDELLKQGSDGGREAAYLLRNRVRQSLRAAHVPEDGPIHVRIFMNVAFISRLLARHSLAGNDARSIAPFIASFNSTQDNFDIVDAGNNREAPYDNPKVRAAFETFAGTSLCGHIVFAGCNDARLLDMFSPYRKRGDKIILIRSATWMPGYAGLELPIEEYDSVFRTTQLDDTALLAPPARKVSVNELPSRKKDDLPTTWRNSSPTEDDSSHESDAITLNKVAVDKHYDQSPLVQPTPKSKASMLPVRGSDQAGMVPVNKLNQRLDTHLEEPEAQDLNAYKGLPRMCANYHLSTRCKRGTTCRYEHDPIDESMRLCLQHYTREIPCPRGSACRFLTCYLGHVCVKRNCFGGKGCKLPKAMHNVNLKVDRWVRQEQGVGMTNDSNNPDRTGNSSPPLSKSPWMEGSWHAKPRVPLPLKTARKHASRADDSPDSRSFGDSTTWYESPGESPRPKSVDLIDLGDLAENPAGEPTNNPTTVRVDGDSGGEMEDGTPGEAAQNADHSASRGSVASDIDEPDYGEEQPVDDW